MTEAETLSLTPVSDCEIEITRAFKAPREGVFDAWTRPDMLKRWLFGPDGWSLATCDVALRPGGAIRFVWRRESDGTEMGLRGAYREVVPPERLGHTERFDEPWYPGEATITTVFAERDGWTTVTSKQLYESREARDVVFNSNMRHGLTACYDRLATLLE